MCNFSCHTLPFLSKFHSCFPSVSPAGWLFLSSGQQHHQVFPFTVANAKAPFRTLLTITRCFASWPWMLKVSAKALKYFMLCVLKSRKDWVFWGTIWIGLWKDGNFPLCSNVLRWCDSYTHKHTQEHISMHDWLGPWQQDGYVSFNKAHQHNKAGLLQWLKHCLFSFYVLSISMIHIFRKKKYSLGTTFGWQVINKKCFAQSTGSGSLWCWINMADLVLATAAKVVCAQRPNTRTHWPGDLLRHGGSVRGRSQQVVQTAVGPIVGGWFQSQ